MILSCGALLPLLACACTFAKATLHFAQVAVQRSLSDSLWPHAISKIPNKRRHRSRLKCDRVGLAFAATPPPPCANCTTQGIYKALLEALCRLQLLPPNLRALIAGGIAGRLVWAKYTAVNYQIVLYLLSRVGVAGAAALAARLAPRGLRVPPFERVYPHLATAVWAVVMHMFEGDAAALHPSLSSSMEFIYHQG